MRPRKAHIIRYACNECGQERTNPAGEPNDGICPRCGAPMRITDTFSDRRIVEIPVQFDRRRSAA